MTYLILCIFIAIILYTSAQGNLEYKDFKKLNSSKKRQAYFRKWIRESYLFFGLAALVGLVLLGEPTKIVEPIVNQSLSDSIPNYVKTDSDALQGFYFGAAFGLAVALVATVVRAKKSMKSKIQTLGDIDALVPQNVSERKLGIYISVAAGINEELFFRAALPVVLFAITRNVSLAIVISIVVFGLGHIYQGWKGVLGTAVLGWILFKVFVLSGNILVPILLHIAIDLWGLVILPSIAQRVSRKST